MNRTTQTCAALILLLVVISQGATARMPQDLPAGTDATERTAESTNDTTVVRLEQLIETALRTNPALHAAYLRAEAMATQRLQARTLPDPTAGIMYQPRFAMAEWRFEQMFPFPGKLRLRGEVAELGAEVAESEAGIVAEDLILQIRQAYDELYRLQEQANLVEQFQEELRNFEEAAATRYEVGEGLQQSILKAQLERNALNIRLEKLAEESRAAMERLAFLLDLPDLSDLEGRVLARSAAVDRSGDLFERALAERPEVDVLRMEIDLSEASIDLAQREFLPDFMLGVNYFDIGEGGAMPTATGRDAVALNVGVRLPLWRGKQRANLQQAKLERSRAEARLRSLETSIRTTISNLDHRLERQERQLALLEEDLLPLARSTVEATLSAYGTGRTSFLDLLDAERMLFNLRMEHVDTRARYLQTSAELERALGSQASRASPQ
jgi:outer membrane protein TolC